LNDKGKVHSSKQSEHKQLPKKGNCLNTNEQNMQIYEHTEPLSYPGDDTPLAVLRRRFCKENDIMALPLHAEATQQQTRTRFILNIRRDKIACHIAFCKAHERQ
jgi:hypothetical protein